MDKYVFMWAEENHNYFDLEPALLNFGIKAKKKFGYGIENAIIFGEDFQAEFYLPEKELRRIGELGYKFLMTKRGLNLLLKEINVAQNELLERVRVLLSKDLKTLNNGELQDLYDFFGFKLGNIFVCYSLTAPHQVTKLEEELINFLKKKKVKDISGAISILTTPKNSFEFSKTGNLLLKSFSETIEKENSKIDTSLFEKDIAKVTKADQRLRKKILNELKPSKKILHLIEVLRILAEKRLTMRFVWMKGIYYSELFLVELKRRFKISKKTLRMYEIPDLVNLILRNKKLTKNELKKRKIGLLKILENSEISTLDGKKAQNYIKNLKRPEKSIDKLVGMVASKGYAVGKVVLFSYRKAKDHSRKIKKMNVGDIVVTEMTRPNIISACEKAGAIITDEGGVLSHAAIVSRELEVPCVIGTKVSTTVLKDGDFVEVDAEKGVIKKITKAEFKQKTKVQKEILPKKKFPQQKVKIQKLNKLKKGNIFWFKDLNKNDLPTVGGKGANLGELFSFTEVPNGFCVSVSAYSDFLKNNKLNSKIKEILSDLDLSNSSQIKKKGSQIRRLILSREMPKDLKEEILSNYKSLLIKKVAVRSSATAEDLPTASFAGQQDTYLNIKNELELVKAIQKCWASLFTERAIYYREKNKFSHNEVLISVVVQEMIPAKFAGVMFTVDPLDKKNILIEVVRGLGEKLVSGEVTPNSYLLDKDSLEIKRKKEEFKFDSKILNSIVKIGKEIENHYGSPQDIEWAVDKKGRIYVLQSRAITTL